MSGTAEEENTCSNRFLCNPNPDEPHEFGECMEDWYDLESIKEQEEIDRRREVKEWEKWIESMDE